MCVYNLPWKGVFLAEGYVLDLGEWRIKREKSLSWQRGHSQTPSISQQKGPICVFACRDQK
jgi:hypothetical protein